MKTRFPYLKRYWVYIDIVLFSAVLLFINIFLMDSRIGEKSFPEFMQQDRKLFVWFLVGELLLVCILVLFCVLACRINDKRNKEIASVWETEKFLGIDPSEYAYIWFDFSCTERALILKQEDKFKLFVDEYDYRTGLWECVLKDGVYDDLSILKKELFYEFDFYCEENAVLDKHGNETYKES